MGETNQSHSETAKIHGNQCYRPIKNDQGCNDSYPESHFNSIQFQLLPFSFKCFNLMIQTFSWFLYVVMRAAWENQNQMEIETWKQNIANWVELNDSSSCD